MTVAELQQKVNLKASSNMVLIPQHWSFRGEHSQDKSEMGKLAWKLTDFIKSILLERRQTKSVGHRPSFLRSDWPRPFARRKVDVEMDWVDPKINDPRQGDLE
ncbi:splicing factor 3B subunit 2 [Trichonephila clavipes]|uniref:Splicing factor 3B subunit 2 n=1 Tax=Trichonephila clavipes TaxID=2585209 RepID=A0A8X6VMK7_TRICX|nr:splicing factor 3B subunit 2 [Trichonephila clavipes]